MKKTVISVVGEDKVGIIFKICKYLAGNQINILDIAQTIVQNWFNMIMIVNIQDSNKDFATISSELKQIGDEIGVTITLQQEEIFDMMHRL
ncbi:MAG: ACT domain-containing protein [Lachnospiraceae bacterium]|nr:ACT domain-containing protein [Lachnospiraceae bacterium]